MTPEVKAVILLRDRIAALRKEHPTTAAGRESLAATIAELETQAIEVAVNALRAQQAATADQHAGE